MNKVKIKKAKIKDKLFLEGEYTEDLPGHSKNDVVFKRTTPIHNDLALAFQRLHVHLAILCDEVNHPDEIDDRVFVGFGARGFTIGGTDEKEGVTISGFKEGTFGNVNLNTPFTRFESEEYPFLQELAEDVKACVYEVEQYLFHKKRAPEQQLEMGFGDDGELPESVTNQ